MHLSAHHCGIIDFDVHTMLGHIHVQAFGQDYIKTLESLIKLEIKTMVDSFVMTSFEQKDAEMLQEINDLQGSERQWFTL
jgi:hypothetical protein